MITHEIPHIFRVQKRWNRENRPILTTLNLRSKSPRFCGHPFKSSNKFNPNTYLQFSQFSVLLKNVHVQIGDYLDLYKIHEQFGLAYFSQ